jgi:hypothetical protein
VRHGLRRTLALLALASWLAGCATTAPPAVKLTPLEELEPEVVPAPTLLIEYPPIELVEPPSLSNPAAPIDMLGIDGGNLFAGFTPGVIYDFVCATTTFGPCPSGPASDYHFIVPAQTLNSAGLIVGTPGNVPRNSIHGQGQVFFDTAIQRDFPVHFWKMDNQKLSLRIELFNAFNHPNLFTPSYTMTDTNFNNTAITINGGRQIKLWLKYSF